MQKLVLSTIIFFSSFTMFGQSTDSINSPYGANGRYINSADKLLKTNGNLVIGGYGEVSYNQPLNADKSYNGKMDVQRMVMLLGYNFSPKTQFISEIEYEHVIEVYVEQAFLQHKINNYLNFRAGLMLIPMGIINEYHEPTTFNGVKRPSVDNAVAPTTWREIGMGFSGNIMEANIKYQAYVVNGFNGYSLDKDKKPVYNMSGEKGFRSGRQKGADSYISSPNLTAKVEYYGIRGLNLGLSGYFGKTQSTLYNNIEKSNALDNAKADSSVIGISMVGLDARYNTGGLQLRGQFYYASNSNTDQYNKFAKYANNKGIGSQMIGSYVEVGYNVFRSFKSITTELIPFVRLENSNTHLATTGTKNKDYNKNLITTGLTYKLTRNACLKADMQFEKAESASEYTKTFNAGLGVMF